MNATVASCRITIVQRIFLAMRRRQLQADESNAQPPANALSLFQKQNLKDPAYLIIRSLLEKLNFTSYTESVV